MILFTPSLFLVSLLAALPNLLCLHYSPLLSMPADRAPGVSHSIKYVVGSTRTSGRTQARQLSQSQIASERSRRQQRYAASLAGFSEESQMILADIQNTQDSASFDDSNMTDIAADAWEYIDAPLQEDGDFAHAVREVMGSQ